MSQKDKKEKWPKERSSGTVYTSRPDIVRLPKGIVVLSYRGLPIAPWVDKKLEEMRNRGTSPAEEKFIKMVKAFKWNMFRQVFFAIKGRYYFLDFYLPSSYMAIEIDGRRYHSSKAQKEHDAQRDKDFYRIGIKTVRFKARSLFDYNFLEKEFAEKMKDCNLNLNTKVEDTDQSRRLKLAISAIDEAPDGGYVIFESNSMSLLYAIAKNKGGLRKGPHPYQYATLLSMLHDKAAKKGIRILCRFSGESERLMKLKQRGLRDGKWVQKWEDQCNLHPDAEVFKI